MSFIEMMESGRGPGVIGMVLALIVLLGFGTLYIFVFDESLQGGTGTIEYAIRQQRSEIDSLRNNIKRGEEELRRFPEYESASKELKSLISSNRMREGEIDGKRKNLQNANAQLAEVEKTFEAYKNQYRDFIRTKAKGQVFPELETAKETYQNVTIREVTPIGVQIRHDGGLKRIPYEELPPELQDLYQFDREQMAEALASETKQRSTHEAEAAAADVVAAKLFEEQKAKSAAESLRKQQMDLANFEMKATALQSEIRALSEDRTRASADAAAARAAGKMVLDKTGNIDRDISAKRVRLAAIMAEIARLKRAR